MVQAAAAQPAAPAAVEAAPAVVKTRSNDKGRSAQQAQARTEGVATAPLPTRDAGTAPDPAAPAHPRQFCEGRNLVTFEICIAVQCSRPLFANHPVCVERRALEQRKRESEQSLR